MNRINSNPQPVHTSPIATPKSSPETQKTKNIAHTFFERFRTIPQKAKSLLGRCRTGLLLLGTTLQLGIFKYTKPINTHFDDNISTIRALNAQKQDIQKQLKLIDSHLKLLRQLPKNHKLKEQQTRLEKVKTDLTTRQQVVQELISASNSHPAVFAAAFPNVVLKDKQEVFTRLLKTYPNLRTLIQSSFPGIKALESNVIEDEKNIPTASALEKLMQQKRDLERQLRLLPTPEPINEPQTDMVGDPNPNYDRLDTLNQSRQEAIDKIQSQLDSLNMEIAKEIDSSKKQI